MCIIWIECFRIIVSITLNTYRRWMTSILPNTAAAAGLIRWLISSASDHSVLLTVTLSELMLLITNLTQIWLHTDMHCAIAVKIWPLFLFLTSIPVKCFRHTRRITKLINNNSLISASNNVIHLHLRKIQYKSAIRVRILKTCF